MQGYVHWSYWQGMLISSIKPLEINRTVFIVYFRWSYLFFIGDYGDILGTYPRFFIAFYVFLFFKNGYIKPFATFWIIKTIDVEIPVAELAYFDNQGEKHLEHIEYQFQLDILGETSEINLKLN